MTTRLTKTDYIIAYMILFIIASFIGGFFLGAKVGKSKAVEEFSEYIAQQNPEQKQAEVLSYSHTDFSTYYYNVYLPFNDFRKIYLNYYHQIHRSDKDDDQSSKTKELKKEIGKLRKQLESTSVANSSPLLQKSHTRYVSTLKAIEEGLQQILDSNQTKSAEVIKQLNSNTFTQARELWLEGQAYFYEAILLWESIFVTKKSPEMVEQPASITMSQWNKLPFHQKNDVVAKLLLDKQILTYFNPEDAVVYLDRFALSSNSAQLNKVGEALDILIASESIRQGEFIANAEQYAQLEYPMIPLFSK